MTRKDLLTGEQFLPKRINQKFTSANNRITYHNKKANELRQSVAYINKPLHTNIRILNEIMKGKKDSIFHKQFLLGKGFSVGVHTHIVEFDGKNHYAIYNYIIISLGNEQIKIINNG
jgi:very-short-patch-repair endonuclease